MLKAKFHAPAANKNIISRQRLFAKLAYVPEYKLTFVVAPAGYGKTTAVLDWLGKCGLPAAWLSIDSHDNTPAVFWQYVCAALEGIAGGLDKDTEYVFASQELMKANIQINVLIDRLSEVQSEFILVLDDLHMVTDPGIMEGLNYLMDYLPAKMHLVFISRTEPALKLAKYKIKGQVYRIGEQDLRFEEKDIFNFYQARGYTLEEGDVKRVENFTEGWAAALVAVAMSLDRDGTVDVIAALAQSSRDIGQFLKDEVMASWRPEKQAFAMKTCILDTLSESLCDAVTGENNAGRMLGEISEENGFLAALDEQKQEYRYHHLFKGLLYRLLSETAPKEIPGLHIRAAHWFREHGLVHEAIEHLLGGGSFQEAFHMIEHEIDHLIHRNDFGTLLKWIERLPQEYKDNSFKIAVIYALYYAESGRYDLSRQWTGRMKALKDVGQYACIPGWDSYSRTVCTMVEANLLVRTGDAGFLPLLLSAAEANDGRYYLMPEFNDFNTSDIYYYRCPINRAARLFGEAPDQYGRMTESYRGMISKNPGYSPLGAGEYLYENNRLEEALPYLLRALEEAQAARCPGVLVPVMVDIARIKRARGDIRGAHEVLDECEKKLQNFNKVHWTYLIQAFRCRLYMDAGDTARVEEWFSSCKLNIFTEMSRIREFELIIYARVLMAKDRAHDARLLLKRLLAFTEENARLHSMVEVLNLLALLDCKNNNMAGVRNHLEKSLEIGQKEGFVRSYMDEFTPMAYLLKYYTTSRRRPADPCSAQGLTAYAKELLRQMHEDFPLEGYSGDAAGMKKHLTPQERQVLELLVRANTNKEIGEKLGIGIRTVKAHTGNIYGKLGVKNRAQCVRMAREVNLLQAGPAEIRNE